MGSMEKPTPEILAARQAWRWTGQDRPPWADVATPGQESVWDYPRPPIVVADHRRVVVRSPAHLIAETVGAVRFIETASPPTFYLPPSDVDTEQLIPARGASICEWKGTARYWALTDQPTHVVGWGYPDPFAPYEAVAGWFSFYPSLLECSVDGEAVRAQPGGFYGGWMTDEIAGPVKGSPGSQAW